MKKTDCSNWAKARRQAGTTLILALVLLLLATLLGVFAMNVGIFAQRTSAADLRTRVMRETLEAALAQGVEYIKNNRKAVVANALGNPCTATDLTFPCGTVPQCATATSSADSSGSTSNGSTTCTGDLARRGKMFYYITPSGSVVDVNGNGNATDNLDKRSLPLGALQMATAGNGFTVNYGVGAVMCMVKKPAQPTDPTECTTDSNKAQGTYVFTLTAAGSISGESATSTGTSSNSTLSLTFGDSPSAPGVGKGATIIASGTADLNGNGTFVTNPNGAGNGLPLTVWTRECVNTKGSGTVNTCYTEDWMRTANGVNGGSTYSFAKNSDNTDSTVVTCTGNGNKTCSCSNSLSAGSGNLVEGIDVLSNDAVGGCTGGNLPVYGTSACAPGANCKANDNITETEFPCDLFQFIFNVQAWDDKEVQSPGTANALCTEGGFAGGGDCFCAYHRPTTVTVADGSSQTMGVDEAWLYTNALYIYDTNNTRSNWASVAKRATSCTDLATKGKLKGGIIWDRTGGCLSAGGQIGYPDKPNLLVSDGTADLQGGTMFGMVFVRDTTAAGSTTTYGGAATFTSHSTGTIYGSVIIQGTADKLNGSSSVVYNQTVMTNLLNLDSLYIASPVPGSWTDRYAY